MKEKTSLKFKLILRFAATILALIIFTQCQRTKEQSISVYSSSQDGDRMTKKTDIQFSSDKKSSLPVIQIDENIHFQKIDGFVCCNAV